MAAEATLFSKEYVYSATVVPPGTMVGMETITAGVPPMGAITRIIGTVTDGDSASGFGFGPYWYYGFPNGYGPWWGPLYPYTYSNYYPYYVPPCCPYPYQRSSNPPPANPAPNSDGDSSPQHFTTPAPENPPSNNYLTDAADPSISLRRTTHGTTGTATDSESAPPSASELPPPRPEVQKAIRALREMPPHARRREIDHGRYSHFSPAERRFLKTALPSRSTFKELETDCASGAAACPQGVNIGRRDFVF